MSAFGDDPNNRSALEQVNEARERATSAVSEMRQRGTPNHHPNLAPADQGQKVLATVATQSVADYLLQLRPYRATSNGWDVNFGGVELPKEISRGQAPGRSEAELPSLWCCQQPFVPIRNVSELIKAANMSVRYSTAKAPQSPAQVGSGRGSSTSTYTVRTKNYGEVRLRDQSAFNSVVSGAMSVKKAIEAGLAVTDEKNDAPEEPGYIPADPNVDNSTGDTRGRDGVVRTYNLVFPARTLLRFVEVADEVAADMNLLIEFETPAEQDGGGF